MKKIIREYFTYTRKERNGTIVLLLILVILIFVRIYQNNRHEGNIVLMDDEFRKEIEEFEKGLIPKEENKKEENIIIKSAEERKQEWFIPDELFEFNPNKVTKDELKKLGFSEKQVKTLISYRKNGGCFFNKTDLLKIYGINKEQYNNLEPYISLENENTFKGKNKLNKVDSIKVELNTATKNELQKLSGIGEVFAERILKYRELLGGFYDEKQLLEVYGIDSVRYMTFSNNILIDTTKIIKININDADYDSLIRHPYLNKYQTKSILKYKQVMGSFSQIEQIYENNLLTKEDFIKIKPYLKLK